ncbi:MAG: MarR family transcriptional regulator, partial [Proteobacteria bacterium]|nr:MarR family transcriptional regulator [Pseudomonadota bacterium]
QAGYVVKRVNMGDRRLVVLSLTGRGRDLMERIIPRALAYQAALMERLGPAAPLMAGALATIIEGEKP